MSANVDPREVAGFERIASRWWDPDGEFRPLHQLNPVRVAWIAGRADVRGAKLVDVGCGGGLLAEAMAERGARVTGIDEGETALGVARLHMAGAGLDIEYLATPAAELAAARAGSYDIVTCLEVLEHVPDPAALVANCAALARPGGAVFFSTLNRGLKSFLTAIVGAEYLLGLLPRGTHHYDKFIRPSELEAHARAAGLVLETVAGLTLDPFAGRAAITARPDVNYLAHFTRPAADA